MFHFNQSTRLNVELVTVVESTAQPLTLLVIDNLELKLVCVLSVLSVLSCNDSYMLTLLIIILHSCAIFTCLCLLGLYHKPVIVNL